MNPFMKTMDLIWGLQEILTCECINFGFKRKGSLGVFLRKSQVHMDMRHTRGYLAKEINGSYGEVRVIWDFYLTLIPMCYKLYSDLEANFWILMSLTKSGIWPWFLFLTYFCLTWEQSAMSHIMIWRPPFEF